VGVNAVRRVGRSANHSGKESKLLIVVDGNKIGQDVIESSTRHWCGIAFAKDSDDGSGRAERTCESGDAATCVERVEAQCIVACAGEESANQTVGASGQSIQRVNHRGHPSGKRPAEKADGVRPQDVCPEEHLAEVIKFGEDDLAAQPVGPCYRSGVPLNGNAGWSREATPKKPTQGGTPSEIGQEGNISEVVDDGLPSSPE